jgi:hypothetical protein
MATIAKIQASRAKRANTNGRVYVNVLPKLGDDTLVYSTVVVPTRFALVYGMMATMAFSLTLIALAHNLGMV